MDKLVKQISECSLCAGKLPHIPRPVVQLNENAKIVIIGQAPGRRVHETGIPWNDRSGDTLRTWLGIDKDVFYDSSKIALMGMGFCYPGKGKSGDLAPLPECARLWHPQVLPHFSGNPLIILVGQYAQQYYLKNNAQANLTATVKNYSEYLPVFFVLPHPSPRNGNWVKVNHWFTEEVLPQLKFKVAQALKCR